MRRLVGALKKIGTAAFRRWPELILLAVFAFLTAVGLGGALIDDRLSSPEFSPALGACLSIGTSGLVALIFYYIVSDRLERRRRGLLRKGVKTIYEEAKENIAWAVLHASRKGGRLDLDPTSDTVSRMLTVDGFKELFEGGREGDEGFYAFENEMSSRTPEYEDIVFNLRIIARAAERLIETNSIDDWDVYKFFIRLNTLIMRIDQNGAGYDESKPLCRFVWEVFAGWNFISGNTGSDPIERALSKI